jgi:hypothetical protein
LTILFGKSKPKRENYDEKTENQPSMLPVTIQGKTKYISRKERRTLINNLKSDIEKLEHWYLDSESRTKGDIVIININNQNSQPKVMTFKERKETYNKKRSEILQQLESLKWRQRFCTGCKKYKKRGEFKYREGTCKDCYSELLRVRREEIEKETGIKQQKNEIFVF